MTENKSNVKSDLSKLFRKTEDAAEPAGGVVLKSKLASKIKPVLGFVPVKSVVEEEAAGDKKRKRDEDSSASGSKSTSTKDKKPATTSSTKGQDAKKQRPVTVSGDSVKELEKSTEKFIDDALKASKKQQKKQEKHVPENETPEQAAKRIAREEKRRQEQEEKAAAVSHALEAATSLLKNKRKELIEKYSQERRNAVKQGLPAPDIDALEAQTLGIIPKAMASATVKAAAILGGKKLSEKQLASNRAEDLLGKEPRSSGKKASKKAAVDESKKTDAAEKETKDTSKTNKKKKKVSVMEDNDDDDDDNNNNMSEDEGAVAEARRDDEELEDVLRSMDVTKRALKSEMLQKRAASSGGNDDDDVDEVEDDAEAANTDGLNNNNNKKKLSNGRTYDPKNDERISRTVFVGNVPIAAKEKDVKAFFADAGKIESIRFRSVSFSNPKLPKKIAFRQASFHESRDSMNAYVVFESEDSIPAALALNNTMMLGTHHVHVDKASSEPSKADPTRSIFVGNLPFTVTEQALRNFFITCGEITNVRVVRDKTFQIGKGIAFIEFEAKDSIIAALAKNGEEFEERPIRVTRATQANAIKSAAQGARKAALARKEASEARKNKNKTGAAARVGGDNDDAGGDSDDEFARNKESMKATNRSAKNQKGAKMQGAFQQALAQGKLPKSVVDAAAAAGGTTHIKKPRHEPREGSGAPGTSSLKPQKWMGVMAKPGTGLGIRTTSSSSSSFKGKKHGGSKK